MKRTFTVITPTLNAERFINDCLDSVEAQGIANHIVVDGGSTDTTCELVKQRNSVQLISANGTGIYGALNIGLKHNRTLYDQSRWVCFLNADDVYANDNTLSTVATLMNETGCSILGGACEFVDADLNHLYVHRPDRSITLEKSLRQLFCISHPSTFFSRDVFSTIGDYREDLKLAADCEFIIRALEKGIRIQISDTVFSKFRRHQLNASDLFDATADWTEISANYEKKYSLFFHKLWILIHNLNNFHYLKYTFRRILNG